MGLLKPTRPEICPRSERPPPQDCYHELLAGRAMVRTMPPLVPAELGDDFDLERIPSLRRHAALSPDGMDPAFSSNFRRCRGSAP